MQNALIQSNTKQCKTILHAMFYLNEITGQVYDTRRNEQMKTIECQSCAMPMKEEQYGSLVDGGKTSEYCHYCMKDGEFTTEQSFEEAVEGNIQFWLEDCNNDEDEARKKIAEVFAELKRWKK